MLQILAQSSTPQSGGSVIGLLLPVLMIAGLYFIMIRPQRNRQRQQQAMLASLRVGDEVMISGGIFGTLTEIDEDGGTVRVEIAPGTTVRLVRQGVIQRLSGTGPDADEEGADEGR